MKHTYILILILLIACKNTKEEQVSSTKEKTSVEVEDAKSTSNETIDESNAEASANSIFNVADFPVKTVPLLETTNFDSFIEPEDYKNIDAKALMLEKIYPEYYDENYMFKAINAYRLELFKDIKTVVVTVTKGEHEMETVLINYKENGNIISSQIVAYDEIAESMSRIESKITQDYITTSNILYDNITQIEQETFKLKPNGLIEKIETKYLNNSIDNWPMITLALEELKINILNVKTDLIRSKPHTDNPDDYIIVIPEIVDEGVMYFELNSHILIINGNSGETMHRFFESSKTNDWTSDAIRLENIQIDTSPYPLSENSNAFGIRVSFMGSSRVNPYSSETLSLFVKSGNALKKILNNYEIKSYRGEWDGDCDGEFLEEKKALIVKDKTTNRFKNFMVIHENTNTKTLEDENSDCVDNKTLINSLSVLKYNGKKYQEETYKNASRHNLNTQQTDEEIFKYVEFQPEKISNFSLPNFDVDNAFQLDAFKIISGNYQPKDGKIVAPDNETDWGDRLLLLDKNNNMSYQSHGIGDAYLFEPHFFKSNASDKTIIICQMAFEYPFGGEVFIFKQDKIQHIGTLDVEANEEDLYLTEFVEIKEINNRIEFSFTIDNLILSPGTADLKYQNNNNLKYVFEDNKFFLEIE